MPNIKSNINVNNTVVKANIKNTNQKISGQIPSTNIAVNSNVKTDTLTINASLNTETNNITTSPKQNDRVIKSNAQTFNDATTERKGIIRIGTLEEVLEGELNNVAITPYTLSLLADKNFVFEQGISSDTWIIQHHLGKQPSVFVVDSANRVQMPDEIIYDNENQVTVQFISAFAGKAYLN